MLHIESPHQGIYEPLSQAMTDSDSEEQLFLRHQQPNQKRLGNRNPPDSLALNQHHPQLLHFKRQQDSQRKERKLMQQQNEHLQRQQKFQLSAQTSLDQTQQQPSSYTTKMQNTFRSVMMSDCGGDGVGSNFSSFNSDYDDRNTGDNVAILGSSSHDEAKDVAVNQQMSPARRFCFGASLILCFLAIFSFVWLVPCTEEGTCPALVDRVKTHNWLSNYSKIELKGGINVVSGLRSWENNLIFLYRGDAFFPEFRPGNKRRNGIISLIGSSGAVAWYDEMYDEPIAIDCTLLDIDRNGQTDCLVMDVHGELGIINPISGQWHWRYKERASQRIDASDFPIILPDLDNDGVLEILLVTSADLGRRTQKIASQKINFVNITMPRNFLRILSGRTGAPIGESFEIHECEQLRKLQLDSTTQTVTFNCLSNKTEARRSKTMTELFALITNKSLMGGKGQQSKKSQTADITQHHQYGQHKDVDAQRNIYSLSGRELVVENRGKCPDDCNVTFILSDGRNGKVKVLRNFTQVGMYGMAPVQWHFKNSKPEMSGFVMKFWKWDVDINKSMENVTANADKTTTNKNNNSKNNNNNNEETVAAAKATLKQSSIAKKAKTAAILKDNSTKLNKSTSSSSSSNQTNTKTHKNNNSGQQWNRVQSNLHQSNANVYDKFEHLIQKRESYTLPTGDVETPSTTTIKATATSTLTSPTASSSSTTTTISNGAALNETNKEKPTAASNSRSLLLDSYKMELITETVILVLFIDADTRIENTSQSNVVQFCRKEHNEFVCQPDLNNQENSILIADLDQDGSQELVSYTSTFVEGSDDPLNYKLITYVRLIRLQAELPAFYNKEKNN